MLGRYAGSWRYLGMNTHPTASLDDLLSHRAWLGGLARALVGDPDRAEDLEQETWRTAIESPPRRGSGRGWLATVLRNRARDEHRRDSRRTARQARVARPETQGAVDTLAERAETQRLVIEAVLALDEPYRGTVLLRYFDDLSAAEVGARMGVPPSTVRTRLQRAHERLARSLERHFGNDRRFKAALLPIAWPKGLPGVTVAASASSVPVVLGAALLVLFVAIPLAVWAPWRAADEVDLQDTAGAEAHTRTEIQKPELQGPVLAGRSRRPDLSDPAPGGRRVESGAPPPAVEKRAGPVQHVDASVVDAQGRPLRDVTVRLVSTDNDKAQAPGTVLAEGRTGGAGQVRIAPFPPTAIARLWAHAGDQAAVTSSFKGFDLKDTPVRIHLGPSRTLAGRLVDPSGTAVAEAQVVLHVGFPGSFEAVAWTTTDGRGAFEVPHVPVTLLGAERVMEGMLEARAPGFTEAWLDLGASLPFAALTFEIERERLIRGRVVDVLGAPQGDVAIELPDSVGGQATDADGRFLIRRLPPRALTLRFSSPAFVVQQRRVPFNGNRDLDIGDVVLHEGVVLEGRVVDSDGKPLSNGWVAVDSERLDHIVRQGPVGEKGRFRFEHLGDEPHTIHVFTGSGAQAEMSNVIAGGAPVEVVCTQGPHVLISLLDDASGEPLEVDAIRVGFERVDEVAGTTTHDWSGSPTATHRIEVEAAGTYDLRIDVEGFLAFEIEAREILHEAGTLITARLRRP